MGLAIITVAGFVVGEPESRSVQNGQTVATFSLGVKLKKDVINWYRVSAWGKSAETVLKYVKKGDNITVAGSLELQSYGQPPKPSLEINMSQIQLASKPQEPQGGGW